MHNAMGWVRERCWVLVSESRRGGFNAGSRHDTTLGGGAGRAQSVPYTSKFVALQAYV